MFLTEKKPHIQKVVSEKVFLFFGELKTSSKKVVKSPYFIFVKDFITLGLLMYLSLIHI